MSEQTEIKQGLRIINKSHAEIKNDTKQIAQIDVNKKTFFAHQVHEWLNYTLNDLSKALDLFDPGPNEGLEKGENEMTHWINKNKKQFDYVSTFWINRICEVFTHLQNFRIQSFELFLWSEQTNVKTCNNELFFDV